MFNEGDKVVWDVQKTLFPGGSGIICGCATTELPVIGRMYIVKLDNKLSFYPYSCVTIQESFLKLK